MSAKTFPVLVAQQGAVASLNIWGFPSPPEKNELQEPLSDLLRSSVVSLPLKH